MTAFIFGDVHGDVGRLVRIIDQARDYARERGIYDLDLYSVGDVIDRGPHSAAVLDICVDRGVKPVLGNHELWFRELVVDGKFNQFAASDIMGGAATLESYKTNPYAEPSAMRDAIPEKHREYASFAPLWRKIVVGGRTYRLTHGGFVDQFGFALWDSMVAHGLTEGLTTEEVCDRFVEIAAANFSDNFLWGGAKKDRVFRFPDGSYQVFGHTPWRGGAEISLDGGYIALDTGCGTCPPYRLSGVLLLDDGDRTLLSA